jgi:hypothetical protein
MKAIEYWFLRIADSDATWFGLGWLRPAKHKCVGLWYIIFSSILLGIPGVVAGAALIYLFFRRVELHLWLAMFLLVLCFELPMHGLFAYFWNRRAKKLAGDGPTT